MRSSLNGYISFQRRKRSECKSDDLYDEYEKNLNEIMGEIEKNVQDHIG